LEDKVPTPRENEQQKDFIGRCIPIVMKEGTAKDSKQASAICYSIWRRSKGEKDEPPKEDAGVEAIVRRAMAVKEEPKRAES